MPETSFAYYAGKVVEVWLHGYYNDSNRIKLANCEPVGKKCIISIPSEHLCATKELAHELACKLAKQRVEQAEQQLAKSKIELKNAMQALDNLLSNKEKTNV